MPDTKWYIRSPMLTKNQTERYRAHGKYRIDVNGTKSPQTRYSTPDEICRKLEMMVRRHRDKALSVFVYAHNEGTVEEDNMGHYIESSHYTAVAKEILGRLERNGE